MVNKDQLKKYIKEYNKDHSGITSKYIVIDLRSNDNLYDKWVLLPSGDWDTDMLDPDSTKKEIHKIVKHIETMILDHLGK